MRGERNSKNRERENVILFFTFLYPQKIKRLDVEKCFIFASKVASEFEKYLDCYALTNRKKIYKNVYSMEPTTSAVRFVPKNPETNYKRASALVVGTILYFYF